MPREERGDDGRYGHSDSLLMRGDGSGDDGTTVSSTANPGIAGNNRQNNGGVGVPFLKKSFAKQFATSTHFNAASSTAPAASLIASPPLLQLNPNPNSALCASCRTATEEASKVNDGLRLLQHSMDRYLSSLSYSAVEAAVVFTLEAKLKVLKVQQQSQKEKEKRNGRGEQLSFEPPTASHIGTKRTHRGHSRENTTTPLCANSTAISTSIAGGSTAADTEEDTLLGALVKKRSRTEETALNHPTANVLSTTVANGAGAPAEAARAPFDVAAPSSADLPSLHTPPPPSSSASVSALVSLSRLQPRQVKEWVVHHLIGVGAHLFTLEMVLLGQDVATLQKGVEGDGLAENKEDGTAVHQDGDGRGEVASITNGMSRCEKGEAAPREQQEQTQGSPTINKRGQRRRRYLTRWPSQNSDFLFLYDNSVWAAPNGDAVIEGGAACENDEVQNSDVVGNESLEKEAEQEPEQEQEGAHRSSPSDVINGFIKSAATAVLERVAEGGPLRLPNPITPSGRPAHPPQPRPLLGALSSSSSSSSSSTLANDDASVRRAPAFARRVMPTGMGVRLVNSTHLADDFDFTRPPPQPAASSSVLSMDQRNCPPTTTVAVASGAFERSPAALNVPPATSTGNSLFPTAAISDGHSQGPQVSGSLLDAFFPVPTPPPSACVPTAANKTISSTVPLTSGASADDFDFASPSPRLKKKPARA